MMPIGYGSRPATRRTYGSIAWAKVSAWLNKGRRAEAKARALDQGHKLPAALLAGQSSRRPLILQPSPRVGLLARRYPHVAEPRVPGVKPRRPQNERFLYTTGLGQLRLAGLGHAKVVPACTLRVAVCCASGPRRWWHLGGQARLPEPERARLVTLHHCSAPGWIETADDTLSRRRLSSIVKLAGACASPIAAGTFGCGDGAGR